MSCKIQVIAIKPVSRPVVDKSPVGLYTSRHRVIDIVSPDADNVYYLITYMCKCGSYITKDLIRGYEVSWCDGKVLNNRRASLFMRTILEDPTGHEFHASSDTRLLPHRGDAQKALEIFMATGT